MTIPNYHVNIFWSADDDAWIADVPDLRTCSAHGATRGAAMAEIETAIGLWVETAEAKSMVIPPATYVPVPVSRPPLAERPFRVEDNLGTMSEAVNYLAVSVHEDSATELIESVRLVGRSPGGKLLAAALGDAAGGPI